jgi:hypothetical protein
LTKIGENTLGMSCFDENNTPYLTFEYIMLNKSILTKPLFILAIYIAAAIIASLLKIALDFRPHETVGYISKVNNFIIYRNSFFHLINHQNLYGYFPSEQYDEFLYSPSFALLIAPFAILPQYLGVVVWCVFNACCVFWAIHKLPDQYAKGKTFISWFVLIELLTSLQNVQVNPLVAALFLFAFTAFEKKQIALASLFIVLSVYIKVFGILGASLFLIYPDRLKFIAWSIVWTVVILALPLIVISPQELLTLYQNWMGALTADHAKNIEDVSVMRMISGISGVALSEHTRLFIQIAAVGLFCLKYLRWQAFNHPTFRIFFLSSAMIWSIIFNHAAESSTYIIAILGVAVWHQFTDRNKLTLSLIILAFLLCCLSPTDIFPRAIRQLYVVPMALKALPCFLIYLKLEYDMLFKKEFVNLKT